MASYQQLVAEIDRIIYSSGELRLANHQRTRGDLAQLFSQITSLTPRVGLFPLSKGYEHKLLQLTGTIPIQYKNGSYNIPVALWIPESYPAEKPHVCVTPTHNMIISPNHPNVADEAGTIVIPYLHHWTPDNNLITLIASLASAFGVNPPLRTRQSVPAPTYSPIATPPYSPFGSHIGHSSPPPAYVPTSSYSAGSGMYNLSGSSVGYPVQNPVPPAYGHQQPQLPPAYGQPPSYDASRLANSNMQPKPVVEQASPKLEVTSAKATLTSQVSSLLRGLHSQTSEDLEQQMLETSNLEETTRLLAQTKQNILRELEHAENSSDALGKQLSELEKFVSESNQDAEINVDEVTEARNPLHRQLMHLRADDAAMEDSLYYLDKALQKGLFDSFDAYLKNVRAISSEQFMKRALTAKVELAIRALCT